MIAIDLKSLGQEEEVQAMPRPPRGPGDGEEENELPMGDPPDDDETDDPDDEDEGEEDDEPMHGSSSVRPTRA